MKTKVIAGLFLLSTYCTLLQAQQLHLSEKEDFSIRTDDFMPIGKMGNSILTYRQKQNDAEILFYNGKMIKEKSIRLDFLPVNFSKIHFVCSDSHLQVFYESKENKKQQLYAVQLMPNDAWSTPLLLDTKPLGVLRDYIPYHFVVSEDKKKVLLYTSYYTAGENTIQAVVVNEKLEILKQILQVFPDKEYYISEKAAISNKGIAYIPASDKPNTRGNIEELKLLTTYSGNSAFFVFPVLLQKYAINEWQIRIDNNHSNVYLAAFFADSKYSNSRGIYFSVFDEEKQSQTTSHFLPVALQISTSKTDLKDLKIRNFYLKKDGGIEIAAEKVYQNIRTINSVNPVINSTFMTTPDNSRTVTEFYYDEIYIFNIKTDGSLAWSQTILKEQLSTDDGGLFSSFSTLQYPLGNVYIFNDLSTRISRLLACYVSASGELNMKELQVSQEMEDWNLMPRSALQISKSEMVIPCIMKNHLSFLKITF